MNVQNRQIYRDIKYISGCLGLRGKGLGRNGEWLLMGLGFPFKVMNVLELIMVLVTQPSEYTKSHGIVHFKSVDCMVCDLYANKAA